MINQANGLSDLLIGLSKYAPDKKSTTLSIAKDFRPLQRMSSNLDLIIPIQTSMNVALPMFSNQFLSHKPFSSDIPTIAGFEDRIDVMNSLQRPKKLTIIGSDGKGYIFLCKAEDDLRKDSRLMELNSIINRLFKKDSESRKRGLRIYIIICLDISTYAVIPLNEVCGLIEWVPNTTYDIFYC